MSLCDARVFETHLADAASLTEGADGAHVALVARSEGWGMKGGGRVQRDAMVGPHISRGLQVVALAEQGQGQEWIRGHSSIATHGTTRDNAVL